MTSTMLHFNIYILKEELHNVNAMTDWQTDIY